jgi:hypothetical protein
MWKSRESVKLNFMLDKEWAVGYIRIHEPTDDCEADTNSRDAG